MKTLRNSTLILLGVALGVALFACGGGGGGGGPMAQAAQAVAQFFGLAVPAGNAPESTVVSVGGGATFGAGAAIGPDAGPGFCGMQYRPDNGEPLLRGQDIFVTRCPAWMFENWDAAHGQLGIMATLRPEGLVLGLSSPWGTDHAGGVADPWINDKLEVRSGDRSNFLGLNADTAGGTFDSAIVHRVNGGAPEWWAGWLPASQGTGEDYVIYRRNPAVDAAPLPVLRCSWVRTSNICQLP